MGSRSSSQRGEQDQSCKSEFKDINTLNWEWCHFCIGHVVRQQRIRNITVDLRILPDDQFVYMLDLAI